MNKIFIAFLVLSFCCSTREQVDSANRRYIDSFIRYIKDNQADTTLFSQEFFDDEIRSKKEKYGLFLLGISEKKKTLDVALKIEIKKLDIKRHGLPQDYEGKVYNAVFTSAEKTDSIFLLVDKNGIKSFAVIRKGDRIISWLQALGTERGLLSVRPKAILTFSDTLHRNERYFSEEMATMLNHLNNGMTEIIEDVRRFLDAFENKRKQIDAITPSNPTFASLRSKCHGLLQSKIIPMEQNLANQFREILGVELKKQNISKG